MVLNMGWPFNSGSSGITMKLVETSMCLNTNVLEPVLHIIKPISVF